MKDKSRDENNVAKATKAFEKFLKDSSANKKRLEQLDTAAKELEVIFPESTKDVSGRARETRMIYDGLAKLQEESAVISQCNLLPEILQVTHHCVKSWLTWRRT
jgi:hypothetical protein